MILATSADRCFEPDLMVLLDTNTALTETGVIGPCNICIEIVSKETMSLDYEYKMMEYQRGQVPEYWIIDPIRSESQFYRLNDEKIYTQYWENQQGIYQTPQLPKLQFHVPTLWCAERPNIFETIDAVRAMLNNEDQ